VPIRAIRVKPFGLRFLVFIRADHCLSAVKEGNSHSFVLIRVEPFASYVLVVEKLASIGEIGGSTLGSLVPFLFKNLCPSVFICG